jgi:hypothetical protein
MTFCGLVIASLCGSRFAWSSYFSILLEADVGQECWLPIATLSQRNDNAVGHSLITKRVRVMATLCGCIRKMCTVVSCPELDLVWFSSFCPGKYCHDYFLPDPFQFIIHRITRKYWVGVVGTLTRLRTGRLGVEIPAGERDFSLLRNVGGGWGAHPASCWTCAGVKRPGLEVNHPSPCSAEIENEWRCTSTPPVCLHLVKWDKVIFTLFS